MLNFYSIILALFTAAAAGLVGSFALMKRMTLAGDVISHIALPGLAVAYLFKFDPLVGAGATLLLGTLLIWRLEKSTSLNTETAIGVIFVGALAIGALLASGDELIEALFGASGTVTPIGFFLGLIGVALIFSFIIFAREKLILSLFSSDLAQTAGINVSRINLSYLLIFSLTILLGLHFLGALLVGALIIIPAAAGRQLTHRLNPFLAASSLISVASTALGFLAVGHRPSLPLGPTIVTIAAIIFVLSLLKKKD
jgi:ABC-type Mn2+/Zn2+ transport system permease subunit